MNPNIKRMGATDDDINCTAKYFNWIISKLPNDIPNDIIDRCTNLEGWVRGLDFWAYDFRTRPNIEYSAKTEKDMRIYLYKWISELIAGEMELRSRMEEEKKWRYVMSHVKDGHWMYRENKSYTYNAIHDIRKFYYEYHIYLLKRALSETEVEDKLIEYERRLNNDFTEKHWKYDRASSSFIEISDSKQLDSNGIEMPSPKSVL